MKYSNLNLFRFAFLAMLFCACNVFGQAAAGKYMESITKEFKMITKDTWDYTSAVAHGKSAKKVDQKRKELINTIKTAQARIQKVGPFEDDKSLRDSVLSFLKINLLVINQDYEKIVDMEEVAEQSYDAMEAYMLAQEKANDKLDVAHEAMADAQKAFADRHGITLVDADDKVSKNLAIAGKAFSYYNRLYLVFFKAYKQEAYLLDALQKNDMNGFKQNADALAKVSQEGLAKLDTAKAFKGDMILIKSAKDMLKFFEMEATKKVPEILEFQLAKENFDKIKAAFDAKSEKSRTKADVDEYNAGINAINKASANFNAINQDLNTKRTTYLNAWNNAVSTFLGKHVPKKS
jgi:hypothetical protein